MEIVRNAIVIIDEQTCPIALHLESLIEINRVTCADIIIEEYLKEEKTSPKYFKHYYVHVILQQEGRRRPSKIRKSGM